MAYHLGNVDTFLAKRLKMDIRFVFSDPENSKTIYFTLITFLIFLGLGR